MSCARRVYAFPGVAVCTLTALVAGGLAVQANESQSFEGSTREFANHDQTVATPSVTTRAIAPPEKLEEQPLDSRLEFSPSPASAQNARGQVEELVETSETEVLDSDKAIANANQSVSDKSLQAKTEESTEALRLNEANTNQLRVANAETEADKICTAQAVANTQPATVQLAQSQTPGTTNCPRPQPIAPLAVPEPLAEFESSPALSINIPVGYGADRNTVFIGGTYQATTRENRGAAGPGGIGIGLGDATGAAGLELSYALANNRNFGEGGFNAKLHRRFAGDVGVALGWNGFLNIGRNDFEHSKYGVITKVLRTQESVNDPFSRVAFTVGVGDGQFRSLGAVRRRENNVNVFGNVAVRVVRPVSFIAEWTGQDLGLGLSIAPFRNFPLVITPAVRDIAGAGDKARFVIGVGTGFRF